MAVIVGLHDIILWMQPNSTEILEVGSFKHWPKGVLIAIQNMRVQRYDNAVKDENGLKELVDLRNRNTFVKYFIMVLINVFMPVWYLLA